MKTIFWSWQSDLDARVTRNLVRDALTQAIKDLNVEIDERLELTSDTKGVPGTPDIVTTILAKIEKAQVFVGDVTPIAVSNSGKALANPNVLIELGYAKHAIGLARIILVWNTAFDGAMIDKLPFDMRGRRAPIAFSLPEGATKGELRAACDKLRKQLHEALRLALAAAVPATSLPQWQPTGPLSALWFDPDTPLLVNEGRLSGRQAISPGPYRYIRILPLSWSAPEEYGIGDCRPAILGPNQDRTCGTTKGGYLTYTGSIRTGSVTPFKNLVMQFRETGELWGVAPYVANGETGKRFLADTAISEFFHFLKNNLSLLARQGAQGPYNVILGVTGLEGRHWISETRWGGHPVALEEEARAVFSVDGSNEPQLLDALVPAWGEIAGVFGIDTLSREILCQQIIK